jgi:hypothetical protein
MNGETFGRTVPALDSGLLAGSSGRFVCKKIRPQPIHSIQLPVHALSHHSSCQFNDYEPIGFSTPFHLGNLVFQISNQAPESQLRFPVFSRGGPWLVEDCGMPGCSPHPRSRPRSLQPCCSLLLPSRTHECDNYVFNLSSIAKKGRAKSQPLA